MLGTFVFITTLLFSHWAISFKFTGGNTE